MTNVSRVNQLIANISQLPPDRAIEILTINLQTAQALAIASARAIDQVAWITLLFSCSNAAVLMLICLKSKTGNRKGSG